MKRAQRAPSKKAKGWEGQGWGARAGGPAPLKAPFEIPPLKSPLSPNKKAKKGRAAPIFAN